MIGDGLVRRFSDSLRWPTRDEVLVTFVVAAGAFEIAFGGGRPSVLGFLTSALALVLGLKADGLRKTEKVDTPHENY